MFLIRKEVYTRIAIIAAASGNEISCTVLIWDGFSPKGDALPSGPQISPMVYSAKEECFKMTT